MKAIVIRKYGSREVLESAEVPEPEPSDDELLVRIHAFAINPVDWKVRQGLARFFMQKKFPIILGQDFSGEVISVGSEVADFDVGDRVFGAVSNLRGEGSYAEYIAVPANNVALMPANMSFEEAAALPTAGLSALQALTDFGHIETGMDVLINGASGGVGHYAVQIAKFFSTHVTAVCGPDNQDFAADLGADQTLDYTQVDFTQQTDRYDIIFDANGNRTMRESIPALQPRGIFISAVPSPYQYLKMFLTRFGKKKSKTFLLRIKGDELLELKKMVEADQLRSHVEHIFSFDQIADAHALSESGHVRGKIVVRVD